MGAEEAADALERARPLKDRLGKIADLLDRSGIDVDELARIDRVNLWQGFMAKEVACPDCSGDGADGCGGCGGKGVVRVPETVDMASVVAVPTWADGPAWPVVQQAKPTVIRHRRARAAPAAGVWPRRTVVYPDTQIGYRRDLDTGELDPIHDVVAIEAAHEIARVVRPWRIVTIGDTFDFAQWSSKFLVQPEFYFTTQPAIDYGHEMFATQRAIVGPDGELIVLEGNHDDRVAQAVARNAAEALRLRRANLPDSWPVMSLPHLVRFDELDIVYVDGYPAGKYKLADGTGRQGPLYARHGVAAGNVQKDAKALRQSFVQGHGHHLSVHAETHEFDGQPFDVEVWSLGCLCRLDGAVPSTKGGTGRRKGEPVGQHESWQHAVGIVTEHEDGSWDVQAIRIRDGRAFVDGRVIDVGKEAA